MGQKPPLRREEVLRILRQLRPLVDDHRRAILIGGQAVAFWAAFLAGDDPIEENKVFTSADIDFEGSRTAVRSAAGLIGGEARLPELDQMTPSTGLVSFVDSDGVDREIDFLEAPYGLRARDIRDTAIRVAFADGNNGEVAAWVMHPERSMESRVHNVVGLGQADPPSLDQLRSSIRSARLFASYVLSAETVPLLERTRAVLNLNERIFGRCKRVKAFRDVYFDHGVDPFDAVLLDPRLPENFCERRYPQMRAQIETQRKKSAAQRKRFATSLKATIRRDVRER